jgi:hypothetical protein
LPDYAKTPVWHRDFEASKKTSTKLPSGVKRMLEVLTASAVFVTECSLPQVLHYNAHHPGQYLRHREKGPRNSGLAQTTQQRECVGSAAIKKYVQAGRFQTGREGAKLTNPFNTFWTQKPSTPCWPPDLRLIPRLPNTLNYRAVQPGTASAASVASACLPCNPAGTHALRRVRIATVSTKCLGHHTCRAG